MRLAITITLLFLLPPAHVSTLRPATARQIPGENSSPYVAIQHKSLRTPERCQLDSLAQKIPAFEARRVAQLNDRGIVLLERKPGVDDATAKKSVKDFLQKNRDWTSVPIIREGDVEQIPINDLIVKFKPGITPARALEVFSSRKLEIIERPTEYSPDRYVVRLTGAPAGRILDVVKSFSDQSMFEYLEPVYVILFKSR